MLAHVVVYTQPIPTDSDRCRPTDRSIDRPTKSRRNRAGKVRGDKYVLRLRRTSLLWLSATEIGDVAVGRLLALKMDRTGEEEEERKFWRRGGNPEGDLYSWAKANAHGRIKTLRGIQDGMEVRFRAQ